MSTDHEASPLLHGQVTGTPLDLITKRLYFIWPLTDRQVEWLNTKIYQDDLFLINYWSFTHTLFGMLWGYLSAGFRFWPTLLSYLITHSIFELWELWAGGYIGFHPLYRLDYREIADVIMDTLFGIVGFLIGRWFRLGI